MTYRKLSHSIAAAALLCTMAAAPAHAQSRDTGVGQAIAAQGNQALRVIRAELKAALMAVTPALPRPAPRAATKVAADGALATATTARCAE